LCPSGCPSGCPAGCPAGCPTGQLQGFSVLLAEKSFSAAARCYFGEGVCLSLTSQQCFLIGFKITSCMQTILALISNLYVAIVEGMAMPEPCSMYEPVCNYLIHVERGPTAQTDW